MVSDEQWPVYEEHDLVRIVKTDENEVLYEEYIDQVGRVVMPTTTDETDMLYGHAGVRFGTRTIVLASWDLEDARGVARR